MTGKTQPKLENKSMTLTAETQHNSENTPMPATKNYFGEEVIRIAQIYASTKVRDKLDWKISLVQSQIQGKK